MMADLVIRGGTIVDGTGTAPFTADVAITRGVISAIGPNLAVKGAREVDARGKLVTPGFVDPHTHCMSPSVRTRFISTNKILLCASADDAQMLWDPMLSPTSGSGVTTVVMG